MSVCFVLYTHVRLFLCQKKDSPVALVNHGGEEIASGFGELTYNPNSLQSGSLWMVFDKRL